MSPSSIGPVLAAFALGRAPASSALPAGEPAAEPPPALAAAVVTRPAEAIPLGCSARAGVCVHAVGETPPATALRALAAAERAYAVLPALGLPVPPPDGGRGGTPGYDVYLDPAASGAGAYPEHGLGAFALDGAPSFSLVRAPAGTADCALESDVARAVVQAALLGLDGALGDGTLAAQASYLGSLLEPCGRHELEAVDAFQRAPERSVFVTDRRVFAGSAWISSFFDATYSNPFPGGVLSGLVAVAAQRTAPTAEPADEPDVLDALRRLLAARGRSWGELWLDFAVARAFAGGRADGAHLPDSERFGALAQARFDWVVELDSLPRRLVPLWPIEPTGSTYFWLGLGGPRTQGGLHLVAQCEESFVFQWALVKLDAAGQEIGRRVGGGVWGQDKVELSYARLDDAAAIVIVGTSLGKDDPAHGYDPDDGVPAEAACEVTLYAQ